MKVAVSIFAVESDFLLPAPPFAADAPADIRVRKGVVDLPPDSTRDGLVTVENGEALIQWRGFARFRVSRDEIVVDAEPSANSKELGEEIVNVCFSVLLHLRGYVVLHGSGAIRGEQVIGICGDSGWGKSTLLHRLVERGWGFFTDDTLILDGTMRAIPGPATLRRFGEGTGSKSTSIMEPDERERVVAAIFALSPDAASTSLTRIHGAEAVRQLLRHSPNAPLLKFTGEKRYFGACADIARVVPLYTLATVRDLSKLDEAVELIESVQPV